MYELQHYGVKGMKWGVRRYQNPDGSLTAAGRKRQQKQEQKERKKLDRQQRSWEQNVSTNWYHAYNRAADTVNKRMVAFNKEWDGKGVDMRDPSKREVNRAYSKAYCDMWNDIYTKELERTFGKSPIDTGRKWCETVPMFEEPTDWWD